MSKYIVTFVLLVGLLFAGVRPVSASHSWGGYHWARSSNPFTLPLGDNLSSSWKAYLGITSSDWSLSEVMDTLVVSGKAKANCRPTSGRVEVCNKAYGNNGWLGIAQIWVSGLHIKQATAKMNDTYFATTAYNTPAWKQMVLCQEVGHTFGLDHQDEDFNNAPLGTCMDYTNDPTPNQHPNAHDYEELNIIYAHLDSFTTIGQALTQSARQNAPEMNEEAKEWGQLVRQNGRIAVYERDFGGGNKLLTYVIYAE